MSGQERPKRVRTVPNRFINTQVIRPPRAPKLKLDKAMKVITGTKRKRNEEPLNTNAPRPKPRTPLERNVTRLVMETVTGNNDLRDFMISYYLNIITRPRMKQMFEGKSDDDSISIIQKHKQVFIENTRGSDVEQTFILKGDDLVNFTYLMYLDMRHDGLVKDMSFETFCKTEWKPGEKSAVYFMFGTAIKPKKTNFIKNMDGLLKKSNGTYAPGTEKTVKENLQAFYPNINVLKNPKQFGSDQIVNKDFIKAGNVLYISADQEDEKHTMTIDRTKTKYFNNKGTPANRIYQLISVANLIDPGEHMLIDSADKDAQYMIGNTPTTRMTWNYSKPKFIIKHDFGETKLAVEFSENRMKYGILLSNTKRTEGYKIIAKVTKKQAQISNTQAKLSKFFGDFFQALTVINQIKKNKNEKEHYCISTGDAMLSNMFVFMCLRGLERPIPPKLWLIISRDQRSIAYGMNDILNPVFTPSPTKVLRPNNNTNSVSSGNTANSIGVTQNINNRMNSTPQNMNMLRNALVTMRRERNQALSNRNRALNELRKLRTLFGRPLTNTNNRRIGGVLSG